MTTVEVSIKDGGLAFLVCGCRLFYNRYEKLQHSKETLSDLQLFKKFFVDVHDTEEDVETLEPKLLNTYMTCFVNCRIKQNLRSTVQLRSFFSSFSRYLKGKYYTGQIMASLLLYKAKKVLKAKQKHLKMFW